MTDLRLPPLLVFLLSACAASSPLGPRASLPLSVRCHDPIPLLGRTSTALSCSSGGGGGWRTGNASSRGEYAKLIAGEGSARGGGPEAEEDEDAEATAEEDNSGDVIAAVADEEEGGGKDERREEDAAGVAVAEETASETPAGEEPVMVEEEPSEAEAESAPMHQAEAETQVLATEAESSESASEEHTPKEGKRRRGRKRSTMNPENSAAKYAKKLKNRNRMNMQRKILHASFGLFFSTLNHVIPRNRFVPGMTILTGATLFMELMRYRKGFSWMNDALHFVLGSQLRKHEMEGKFTGSFYYFLGVTCTAYLFPKTAASMGMAQLALADPSASYFGRQTRHIYWSRIGDGLGGFGRNKGILGFLGGALFCFPYNFRVFSVAQWGAKGIPGGQKSLLAASFALGFAGAFADLAVPTPAVTMPSKVCGIRVPPFHIDDNFVVPIFSGWACTKIFEQLGWSQDVELAKYILF
eukprot:CAMPEP_0197451300 /NCGR_PEP_ID=MMETSP1175-20131217/28376_1 /TAXON_ID=1003142 /ORGANISM="Triceratium dubium, Strain CCMP147" /LENGTH=468 /DNA_ID=CAMNT_0042983963 /DNA_START=12 /DNA_END=1418 /DNA_ORIENTATION=+